MYFIIKIPECVDPITFTLDNDHPSDNELIEFFQKVIPQFSEKKQYVITYHSTRYIVYQNGIIYHCT